MNKVLALTTTLVFSVAAQSPLLAAETQGVSDTTVINAPKEFVWTAVTSADKFDADIKSAEGNEAIVGQKFDRIPFFGSVQTTLKVRVKENELLSYELIKSDKLLKEMSGSWLLTPIDKNKTQLKLTSSVDPGLPIPRFLVNKFIKGKVKSRLGRTRKLAEQLYESKRKTEISQKSETERQ